MIYVTQSSMPPFEEYANEIRGLWDSYRLTNMGDKHNQLQADLENFLKVENVELLVNGHMALEMTLQAMNLSGEVITTPFTFASTTHAIVRSGLKPVFCDISYEDFTIDVNKIEHLITPKTSAILPVHVYGNICDIEEIEQVAKKHGLKVIFDAAHTFGEEYKGKGVGTFGDASVFSFHATKVFHSIEGGCVTYSDENLGKRLFELKNFGIHGPESVAGIGANAKMNEFCAAMGICNLRHIGEEIQKRKAIFDRYIEKLDGVNGLKVNSIKDDVKSNYSYFPIIIENAFPCTRDVLFETLLENGIMSRKYFYPTTNAFECYEGIFDPKETPVALDLSKRVLTLPLYANLELEDVDRICKIITDLR